MIVIDFGGDFLKLNVVGADSCMVAGFWTLGGGCSCCWAIGPGAGGKYGAAAGGAGGSEAVGDFVQNFFHIQNVSKIPMAKKQNIISGDEKIQCFDWKGSSKCSSLCNSSLASNAPVFVSLISVAILVICSASSWSKSWDKVIVQSSQAEWTSMVSVSSAVMRWSIVAMWHPGCTVTAWPERIVSGVLALALGHTWLVAIEPIEYTSQVLFPRLNIFSRVSEIRNLQLVLI